MKFTLVLTLLFSSLVVLGDCPPEPPVGVSCKSLYNQGLEAARNEFSGYLNNNDYKNDLSKLREMTKSIAVQTANTIKDTGSACDCEKKKGDAGECTANEFDANGNNISSQVIQIIPITSATACYDENIASLVETELKKELPSQEDIDQATANGVCLPETTNLIEVCQGINGGKSFANNSPGDFNNIPYTGEGVPTQEMIDALTASVCGDSEQCLKKCGAEDIKYVPQCRALDKIIARNYRENKGTERAFVGNGMMPGQQPGMMPGQMGMGMRPQVMGCQWKEGHAIDYKSCRTLQITLQSLMIADQANQAALTIDSIAHQDKMMKELSQQETVPDQEKYLDMALENAEKGKAHAIEQQVFLDAQVVTLTTEEFTYMGPKKAIKQCTDNNDMSGEGCRELFNKDGVMDYLLPNLGQKQMLHQKLMATSTEALLAVKTIADYQNQIDYINEQKAKLAEMAEEAGEDGYINSPEDVMIAACEADPSLPQCQTENDYQQNNVDGYGNLTISGGGSGFVNGAGSGQQDYVGANHEGTYKGSGSTPGGVGIGSEQVAGTGGGVENSAGGSARVKYNPSSGGGGGGGGGSASLPGAAGGGGGARGVASNGKAKKDLKVKTGKFKYSKAKGRLGYKGAKRKIGNGSGNKNPFAKFFKKGKGKNKNGVMNFRSMASIGKKKGSIFERISSRYGQMVDKKRLLEYERVKK